jgi:hypothetical protein
MRVIQIFWDSTIIFGSSQAIPSYLKDRIPKGNKHSEVIEGDGEVFLLELVAYSRELKSSLKNKNQDLHFRERERGELKLWISNGAFDFLSNQQP